MTVLHLQRDCFESGQCLTSVLDCVGHVRCTVARKERIVPHSHPNCFEIFYFVRGSVRWWVADKTYELSGNHVMIHPLGVLHGAEETILKPCEYYWIRIREPSLRQMEYREWNGIIDRLSALKYFSFPGVPELAKMYQALFTELFTPDSLSRVSLEATLLQIIIRILRAHDKFVYAETPGGGSTSIKKCLAWCDEHLCDASLEGMREVAKMPMEHFRQVFTKEVGLTPLTFIHHRKINLAKRLMLEGRTVTSTAHELGFSSSQHMSTLFRKIEGISPTQFIGRQNLAGRDSMEVERCHPVK